MSCSTNECFCSFSEFTPQTEVTAVISKCVLNDKYCICTICNDGRYKSDMFSQPCYSNSTVWSSTFGAMCPQRQCTSSDTVSQRSSWKVNMFFSECQNWKVERYPFCHRGGVGVCVSYKQGKLHKPSL